MKESGLFGMGGPVIISTQDYPHISPIGENGMGKAFLETHCKSPDWKYEKEYRFTRLFFPEAPSDEERTISIPDNFIAEIIIGINTSPKDAKEILEIAKQKNIRIYKAE